MSHADRQQPGQEHGFAPAPGDYLRRIALGHISATAAAREYLDATKPGHSPADVNDLAGRWQAEAHARRTNLLGKRLADYQRRVDELVRSPMSTPAAQATAFTELVPDAAIALATWPATAETPTPVEPPVGARFRPAGQDELAPSGEKARIRANLAALRTLRTVVTAGRRATAEEQAVLARWSGWGAVPAALDPTKPDYAWVRDALAELLDERELAAARRTVINAHYTDAALVQAIWDAVARLGFTGGRVLEPGCGSGNFIAFAPDTAEITGIELDPTTAAIAAVLHPHAQILAESFADTSIRTRSVDVTIGNVPFGDVRLHDKRDNPGHHSIHNHFVIKSLRATRPGGLVAVISSAYTMDAANPAARREMAGMADLLGAVRLPNKAHSRAAGTDALTDVLIFRRREDDREPAVFDWEYTTPIDVDGVPLRVNTYFAARPQRVLGHFAIGLGLYRLDEVSVAGDPAAAPGQLRDALAQIAADAEHTGLTMTPAPAVLPTRPAALLPHTVRYPDGYLRANADATFSRLDDGVWEPYAPPKTQAVELRALLGLRDTAVALLEAEAASREDTDEIDALRAELNRRYDTYTATHDGPINRFTETPARRRDKTTNAMVPAVDEETGETLMRRVRPPQGGFRRDPFAPVVAALEVFDEQTQTAAKADIFTHRVVAPRPPRLGADTPADALAICLDEHGEIRLPAIAWLLGIDEPQARQALGTLVFDDPDTATLQPAAAYLSGDVKAKLAIARAAAEEDDRYATNVAALTGVVPQDLGPDEIVIKMGAPWIGAPYIRQFLTEILDDPTIRVEYGGGAMWSVDSDREDTVAARSTWGTERRSAAEIAQHILEQREFVIKDTVGTRPNQRQVVNIDAIMAATEKAVEIRERFADWVWEDSDRAAALVATYNDTFRRYVPRSYHDLHLSLPGLAMSFKPDPHQIAAVARIVHEPAVGLYHAVGAGKTASMIMGAMELRRLGLATKPVIVVPNQLLDQWSREFLRLYPQAKVLAASGEDLQRDQRRLMVARMATGDWDTVILTEAAFEMLPMTPDAEQAYIDQQLAELDERISAARTNGAPLTLKRLETMKANREARLTERLDTDQDAGIWWELTGIDYIFRDESHRDKNLRTVSNVPGMSIKGSQRAQQMDLKLAWLRQRQPRWGTRATGTPIANSLVELFTEYRYLRPDLMEAQGITDVDSFLATYAEGEVVIEVTPDGGGLRNKTRHKFVNLDELITPTRVFADVKTKDDLGLPRPPLAARADGDREPEVVIVKPSTELLDKVADLVERAAKLKGKRPEKGSDNILKIVGEGASAALDLRLVGLSTNEPQKLDVAADRIAGIYHAHIDRVYQGPDGQPHPRTGALQLVFCDLGTPSDTNPEKWTSYGQLRTHLTARGVPREKIRFIHDAKDDRQRAEMFAACRDGRVGVLIGSTEKMGTGVNVQDRLLALHHLDCPWRPCDLEQREGRIDRRGNQNPEIHILRYVTERSLDAFRWQKVAYKARLADQILRGQAGREADDIGEATLSYEEMKAAATGNPLLVEHAKAKADLARLERLERGHHRTHQQLRWTIRNNQQEIGIHRTVIAEADAAIARRDNHGNGHALTVRGRTHTTRAEANERLRNLLGLILADPRNLTSPAIPVGEYRGFTITAKADSMPATARAFTLISGLWVELASVPGTQMQLFADDLTKCEVVTRLDNRLAKLETVRHHASADISRRETEVARAEQDLAKPFRHEQALAEARTRSQHLDVQVIALAAAEDADTGTAGPGDGDLDPSTNHEPARTPGASRHTTTPSGTRPFGGRDEASKADTHTDEPAAAPEPVSKNVAAEPFPETQRTRRGHAFYPPADLAASVPRLYATESSPVADKILHLHFFGGPFDAWLAEYDPTTGEGFGYVSLGDPDGAEWGYVDLTELEEINTGQVIIERDLHWNPVPASLANLPGRRAPRPTAEPSLATAPAAVLTAPVNESAQHGDGDANADSEQVQDSTSLRPMASWADLPDLTPQQRAAIDEIGKDKGAPWSIQREWRIRTFAHLSGEDLAGLPADLAQALTAEIRESLNSPAWPERATARRLLDLWSGHPNTDTDAQQQAVDALCMPASSHDLPDAGRLNCYGRLTVGEYLTLDAGYQQDIKDDLKAIADSGATKTIPRNRSGTGSTVRTVADHVTAAGNLLRRLGSGLEVPRFNNNAATIGKTVLGLRLNPGDQIQLRGGVATVDRVGIDLKVHLVGGGTLPDSTHRYRLLATGPESSSEDSGHPVVINDNGQNSPAAVRPVGPQDRPSANPMGFNPPPAAPPPDDTTRTVATSTADATNQSVEQRLLARVAARTPANAVERPGTREGHPSVLLAFVANGTYGQVTGIDLRREPITVCGYVLQAHGLRGGYGGWHPDTVMVVELGELPDGPVSYTVQTEMDARLSVLDPAPGMPAGEAAPWLRMPVEEQILAARTTLGLTVEVHDGPANELWNVQGCPAKLTGEVAAWLFGGRYHSWEGRARPAFRPALVQEAIASGRAPIHQQPAPAVPDGDDQRRHRPTTTDQTAITSDSLVGDAPSESTSVARLAFTQPPSGAVHETQSDTIALPPPEVRNLHPHR